MENKIYTKDEIELDWQQTHQGFSWRKRSEYDWKSQLKKDSVVVVVWLQTT